MATAKSSKSPIVKYISWQIGTIRNALSQIQANLLKSHISPKIVHTTYSAFTVSNLELALRSDMLISNVNI